MKIPENVQAKFLEKELEMKRSDSFCLHLTKVLGTENWVVAPRLTVELRNQGYDKAITSKRFEQMRDEFENAGKRIAYGNKAIENMETIRGSNYPRPEGVPAIEVSLKRRGNARWRGEMLGPKGTHVEFWARSAKEADAIFRRFAAVIVELEKEGMLPGGLEGSKD